MNLKQIPNSLAVFCLATYGEGDPTDNAMEFYEWIQNGDADLTGLNYAVSKKPQHHFKSGSTAFWSICNFLFYVLHF